MRPLVLGIVFGLPCAGLAQDLNRLTPAPVPPQVEAPTAFDPAEILAKQAPQVGNILVEQLESLVIGSSPEAVMGVEAPPGLTVVDAAWLDSAEMREGFELFLNRPVDEATIPSLSMALRLYVGALGYPYSLVYLPEQDITDGVLRVVVVRARLESEIAIEGARYFSERQYRAALRLKPDAPLAEQTIQADVDGINRNPFRASTIEARAGSEPGTTQLVLRVRETRPVRVFVSANNGGTESTQEERVSAGVNWGNAFGLGHQLSAQWNSSWDFKTLRSGAGSYLIDLPWRHTLSFNGAYARTNGLVTPPFALKGTSWQIAANYDIPLAARGAYTHAWQLGLDFKASDNNFTFASIPITDNLTHVVQARVAYSGQFASRWGRTSFRAALVGAPGGLTNRNKSEYFAISRSAARADYVYFSGDVSHAVPLDPIKRGLSWSARGQLQLANHNLIGSEQFGGGGAYSVRGYEEGEVYKDNGGLLSHELRLPPFPVKLGRPGLDGQLQFYVFEDYAYLWSSEKLPGESNVDLHSAGVGVDYFLGRHASLRAAYGWQFTDSGSSESGDNARLHLSASVSF